MDLRQAHAGIGGRLLYWEYIDRLHKAMKWNIPSTVYLRNTHLNQPVLICGAGPSIRDDIPKIEALRERGAFILTCNKTYEFLKEFGIVADFHCMLDPMPWVADYVKEPVSTTKFLVAHQCDPAVVRKLRLKGANVYIWVSASDYYGVTFPPQILTTEYKDKAWSMVAGPTTVGLRAIHVAYDIGFRAFHMFGMDSSMRVDPETKEARLHAMPKDKPKDAMEGWVTLNSKTGSWRFYTNNHMSKQVTDFQDTIDQIVERVKKGQMENIDLTVYGDGLLPAYAASVGLHADPEMRAKYQGAFA